MKIKKLILLIIMCFMLTGCSLLPKVNFGTPGTVPQSIDKSKAKDVCKGATRFNELGEMTYCSKGYHSYAENFEKKERKMTIVERIKGFINSFIGWGFWGFVLIVILCPGLIGSLLTFLFSASRKVARETINAVKKFRRESAPEVKENLDNYLRAEQSMGTKKYVSNIRKSEE